MLRVTSDTIYAWSKRGEIPSIKIGGRRLFLESRLWEWIDAQAVRTESSIGDVPGPGDLGGGLSLVVGGDEADGLPPAKAVSERGAGSA